MNLEPMNDRIIVIREDSKERTTDSGLVVPTKRSNLASIVACGNDITELHVGQIVLLSDTAGVPFEHEGNGYLVIRQAEILARLK